MVQVGLRGFQGSLKEVQKVCQGCFNGVSGSFKEVSWKVQECLKEVSRVFQDSYKGVSRQIEGDFSVFQGYFKNFKRNFRKVSKVFQAKVGLVLYVIITVIGFKINLVLFLWWWSLPLYLAQNLKILV